MPGFDRMPTVMTPVFSEAITLGTIGDRRIEATGDGLRDGKRAALPTVNGHRQAGLVPRHPPRVGVAGPSAGARTSAG